MKKPASRKGFTLVEVMIALAIFFVAVFSILEMVTQAMKSARALSQNTPNAGILAADLSMTNSLVPGVNFGDFGTLYPGYSWSSEILPEWTNGLFRVSYVIFRNGKEDSQMSILLYRPQSPQPGTSRGSR